MHRSPHARVKCRAKGHVWIGLLNGNKVQDS